MEEVRVLLRDADPDGELPPCHLRSLALGPGVLEELPELLDELLRESHADPDGRVVLLVDPVLVVRDGADVKLLTEQLLAERFDVVKEVLDDGHDELHVVDDVVAAATDAVRGAVAVVALGGGTVSDIGKLASGPEQVLVTVQTAASVDGYTDDVSVLLRDGVKRTVPSRWPDAVVADAATIAGAPAAMTRAGFGEMTSMLTAPADWYLASLVGTEQHFHEGPIRLLDQVGDGLGEWSAGVGTGDPVAVERLTHALAVRGIVTGVAGTTAALSGVEHLVSHMCDLHHAEHGLPMGLHGAQVGVGSVVAAACWELLTDRLATGPVTIGDTALDTDEARARVDAAFGPLGERIAQECWRDYSAKLATVSGHREQLESLLADWTTYEKRFGQLVLPSDEIATRLRAAGAATTFDALDPVVGPELGRWAVAHCALMRNRFTVVDLLTLLGWWREADVDDVLQRVAAVTQ